MIQPVSSVASPGGDGGPERISSAPISSSRWRDERATFRQADRAAGRQRGVAARPLSEQGLRLPGGVRAGRRTRLHRPRPLPRGEEKNALERDPGFRARRWVVERTHSWLKSLRRSARTLVEEAAQPPRPAPARLRPDRLATRDRG